MSYATPRANSHVKYHTFVHSVDCTEKQNANASPMFIVVQLHTIFLRVIQGCFRIVSVVFTENWTGSCPEAR